MHDELAILDSTDVITLLPARFAAPAARSGATRSGAVMAKAIAVGDKLPQATFKYFDSEGNMKEITTDALCKGKKVVLFAVPGAFTPTCSLKHLPGFIEKGDEIKSRGVDSIACISVNDVSAGASAAWAW
jgi:peroxiredoxin